MDLRRHAAPKQPMVAGGCLGLGWEEKQIMNTTATLAHSITWTGSKQSYLTARLLVDRDLVDDCMRAYAYFRWADDVVDISLHSSTDRIAFIAREKMLIETLYSGRHPADLCMEEEMLADLISHDRGSDSGLRSFIRNFMAVIEFDANRNGRLVSHHELNTYTIWLATAVMDGIQYFIGNGHPYPKTPDRTVAVVGAHLVHMLRDTLEDLPAGFVNIPAEDIQRGGICLGDVESESFRLWVRGQVERARICFWVGKRYIDSLEVLRCKLAGAWYCARFEWFLNTIQRDGYRLRRSYPERQSLTTWVEMAGLGITITLRHIAGRIQRSFLRLGTKVAMGPEGNISSYRLK
jgi:phytoene/squalene synthetase